MKNVSFNVGEELGNGYSIKGINGVSEFIAENEQYIICFRSDSGEGRNYMQIQWITNKETGRQYRAWRYFYKFISLVSGFSSQLYFKYKENN